MKNLCLGLSGLCLIGSLFGSAFQATQAVLTGIYFLMLVFYFFPKNEK